VQIPVKTRGGESVEIDKGDVVMLECAGHTHVGKVRLCSQDRQSLTVRLQENSNSLKSPAGGYVRLIPLEMRDGAYHELLAGERVEIAVIQRAGSTRYIEFDRRD
jgi:hypothetical protein